MKVAITGASGLIGSALVERLRADGHDVRRLVRRDASAADEVRWDPGSGAVDRAGLAGVEGVVHLAGAGIGDHRWTDAYRSELLSSRVDGTRTLVTALAALDPVPRVLVSGSAIGVYGDRRDEELTEASAPGQGFLADVVQAWEAEARRAEDAGIRVALARTGLVLSPKDGALGRLLPLVRLGLGGPLGSGRQWWSWISLKDQVRALEHLLTSELSGPVNLTAPEPVRQAQVVRALAHAAHRPSGLPTPGFALRAVLGSDLAEETVLVSQRVLPARLEHDGFDFVHDDIDAAAAWVVRRP